jgi:hypothetical protein
LRYGQRVPGRLIGRAVKTGKHGLSLSLLNWAYFRRTKGAIKLHLLLDHDGYLPSFAVITTGKTNDIKVARKMRFDPASVLIMDRGYIDYEWFVQLTQQAVYFVTRLKDRASFEVAQERSVPAKGNILKDQIIFFHSQAEPSEEYFFRLVEVWLEEKKESVVFLTNNLEFGATTIAAIYKERWQVELFFKAIKQNLKIKTFLGTSANAVKTQIWTALIAMLILRYLQLRSTFSCSLSNRHLFAPRYFGQNRRYPYVLFEAFALFAVRVFSRSSKDIGKRKLQVG